MGVEKVVGRVGDQRVTRHEEGLVNSATEEGAFGVDSMEQSRETGGERIKDGARRDRVCVGQTEEKAVHKVSFLSRGLASRAGNDGKETAGADELEPRVTEERAGGPVAAVMAASENLTMVKG